jgi:hypothetical protein
MVPTTTHIPTLQRSLMANTSTNITWSAWSLSTKLAVGSGIFFAALLVVWLYLPH